MKITTIIIRILFGALLLFGSISYFSNLFPQPELTGEMKTFNDGINASIYLMPVIKVIELICGLAFISNRYVSLATVLIFPISINILGIHVFLAPEGLPIAAFVFGANLFLAYVNKEHYKSIFVKRSVFSIQYEDPHIWGERDKGNALYLHRIVANQQYKGKKIFAKVLEWTIDFAKSNAKKYVRMDTWADNIQLIEYYKAYGFQFIENFRTTNTPELPIQNQNLDLILLELKIDEIKHNCS